MATFWERVKTGGKTGFDKAYKVVDKLGPPVNKLSNKLGSEAFWPTTLDKESDKAARILQSFCKDGFYAEEEQGTTDGPKQKQKVLKKIPAEVIKNAKALAIFTTMRTGLWMSGAGGSGILIAKKDDGSWSPPSGIMLHTAGLGFMVGIDIYDCVVVINSAQALEAFYKIRCTLGSEVSVAAGPIGAGGVLETEVHKRQAPIFTYMKSRGFYAGVQIDGTIVIERTDENERFYGQKIGARDILEGKVQYPPTEVKRLLETIKAAQGDTDVDESFLPSEPPPSDYEVDDGHLFGVPDNEDPDPYGVLALEKEGMAVRDANTHERASWEQFSFNPSPTSPIHAVFAARTSGERPRSILSRPASWRTSTQSSLLTAPPKAPSSLRTSMEQTRPPPVMADSSTQTDFPDLPISGRSSMNESRRSSRGSANERRSSKMQGVPENDVLDTSPERREPVNVSKANGYTTPPRTPPLDATPQPVARHLNTETDHKATESAQDQDHDYDDHEEAQIIEQPVVHSIQTIQPATQQKISKARLVTVAKRTAPKLPPRNPNRNGKGPLVIGGSPTGSTADDMETSPATSDKESGRLSSKGSRRASSTTSPPLSAANADVSKGMEEIKLTDNDLEDEEIEQRNPWAKVQEKRKSEEEKRTGRESMPGGFD